MGGAQHPAPGSRPHTNVFGAGAQCATALKEWATVLEAMARGEQLVLIRKGGLIEPGSGFEMVADRFVFYPTFEHQAVQYLRPEFQPYFAAASSRRAPPDQLRVELAGVVVASTRTMDPGIVEQLAPYHIYNDAFLHQRLKWQPEQPLVVAVVRAFRLAQPRLLPVAPAYAGCKSWVELDAPVALDAVSPALDDRAFEQRLAALLPLLEQGRV